MQMQCPGPKSHTSGKNNVRDASSDIGTTSQQYRIAQPNLVKGIKTPG